MWRIGNRYKIHVYDNYRPVATFFTETDAARVIQDQQALLQITRLAKEWMRVKPMDKDYILLNRCGKQILERLVSGTSYPLHQRIDEE